MSDHDWCDKELDEKNEQIDALKRDRDDLKQHYSHALDMVKYQDEIIFKLRTALTRCAEVAGDVNRVGAIVVDATSDLQWTESEQILIKKIRGSDE